MKKTIAEEAEQDCVSISEELSKHLQKDDTKAKMFQWHSGIP